MLVPLDADVGMVAAAASPAGLVALGTTYPGDPKPGARLIRLRADGSADASFGSGGVASIPRLGGGLALDAADRPVVVGSEGDTSTVVRLQGNGTADPTFDQDGQTTVPLGSARGLSVDHHGRLLVAGAKDNRPVIARLTADGQLDTAFGKGGLADLPSGTPAGFVFSVTPDDGIILAGTQYEVFEATYQCLRGPGGKSAMYGPPFKYELHLIRLDSAGAPASPFGPEGRRVIPQGREVPHPRPTAYTSCASDPPNPILGPYYVVELPGGRVQVGGGNHARYAPSGGFDPSFGWGFCGTNTRLSFSYGGAQPLPDGRMAVANGNYLAVIGVDGTLDGSFSPMGVTSAALPEGSAFSGDPMLLVASPARAYLTRFLKPPGSDRQHLWTVSLPIGTARPSTIPYGDGVLLAASDGRVVASERATTCGRTGPLTLNRPIVGIAASPSGRGYWLVAADGGVFAFGDASFLGSTGNLRLNQPVVGMAATPTGKGYWLVAADGGVFAFGDAGFSGSTGDKKLNRPIVGITPSSAAGYWLVASDGGIFTFGDARFFGSAGNKRLSKPVVALAATETGQGYWLVASDGGVFTFGDADFNGSGAGKIDSPVIGMVVHAAVPNPYPNSGFHPPRYELLTAKSEICVEFDSWYCRPADDYQSVEAVAATVPR